MGRTKRGIDQKGGGSQRAYLAKTIGEGWKPYLLIVLVGLLVYSKAFFAGFVGFDDTRLLIENYSFINNLKNLPNLFVDDIFHGTSGDSLYRPILAVSLMFDSQFGKNSPFVYHLTNVLIHLFASCLVFAFLNKMRYRKDLAFLFSLIFTVHPLLTQAVAWIPGRNDSLLALFVLLAFIFFLKFIETKQWKDYGWHMAFFSFAAFTKESGIILLPVCVLYLLIIAREGPFSRNQKILGLGWVTVLVFWAMMRSIAVGGMKGKAMVEIAENILIHLPAIVQVIGKIFLPFNLSILPTMEDTTFLYGILSVIGLSVVFLFSKVERPLFAIFGFLWFLLFLLPSFIPTFYIPGTSLTSVMEHRNYVPVVGLILTLGEIGWLKNGNLSRGKVFIPVLIIVIFFSAITFLHISDFKDKLAFWQNAVLHSPGSPIAHMNLGSAYHTDGQLDRAEMEFRKTLELNPNQAMGYSNLADIAIQRNRLQEAMHYVQKALAADPLYAEGHYNLGKIHYLQNNLRESELALTETIRLKKDHFAAHFGLGILYLKKERLDDAEKMLRKALELNPFYPDTLFNLGVIRSKQGRLQEAEELWVKALRLKPDHVDAELHLAIYYYNKRDFSKAARHFSALRRKGLRIDPKIAEQLNIQ